MWPALRSEWIKIVSMRSTWIALAVVYATMPVLNLFRANTIVAGWAVRDPLTKTGFHQMSMTVNAVFVAGILVAVLGVLSVSEEYRNRMIHLTFLAVPVRGRVLAAKAIVLPSVCVAAAVVATAVTFLLTRRTLAAEGIGAALGDPGVPRALLFSVLACGGFSLYGVAIGALVRNTALAVGAVLVVLVLLPVTLAGVFGDPLWVHYYPSLAVLDLVNGPATARVEPVGALVSFFGGLALLFAAGTAAVSRRDA